MRKKFLAVVLAAAMACNMTGVSAAAQPAVAGMSLFKGLGNLFSGDDTDKDTQADTQKSKTRSQAQGTDASSKPANDVTLDIGRGDIIISGNGITAFDTEGNPVTKTSSQYVVTGTTQEHSIQIAEGVNANIILSNASIIRTEAGESPFWIADDSGGNVTLTLQGTNNLQAGEGAAAIQKNCTHAGSSCKCGQLRITCGNTGGSHVCDENCGTLVAAGAGGAAGIGGAAGMGSSKIDIECGTITASGGVGGASGGVGTKVDVGGGVVDAGAVNGNEDGGNIMNGNALLFADSTAGLNLKKGVLYQNGVGTVYGAVKLSQAMVNHLPAGSTLNIPEGSGASLTVDEDTDISHVNVVGSEVKREKSKVTPTPEPVIEEEVQEQQAADPGDVSGNTPTDSPTPNPTLYDSNLTNVSVKRNGNTLTAGQSLVYGEKLTIEGTLMLYGNQENPNKKPGSGSRIEIYLRESTATSGGIAIGDRGVSEDLLVGGAVVPVDMDVTIQNPSIEVDPNKRYIFVATFTGTAGSFPPCESAVNVEFPIAQGNLTPTSSVFDVDPAIAGRKISDLIDLDRDVNIRPTNSAGEEVAGHWEWADENGNTSDDISISVNGTFLYPLTADSQNEFSAKFVLDGDEQKKYSRECMLTVRFNVVAAFVEDAKIDISPDNGNKNGTEGHDGKRWYNAESGTVTITVEGYQILQSATAPTSANGWENASWRPDLVLKDDPGDPLWMEFHSGRYQMYVKKMGGSDIGTAVIEEFNVDRGYPVINTSIRPRITGETAAFQFDTVNESNESGVYLYYLLTQARPNGSNALGDEYTRDQVKNSRTVKQDGAFNLTQLHPNTYYDLYLLVEDNACNEAQYIKRVVDVSGNKIGESWELVSGDNLYHGYEFVTGNEDIKGNMSLTVYESDGTTLKPNGNVASGDILKAEAKPDNSGVFDISYEWYRRSANGAETRINTVDSPEYTVRDEDIGYIIVCHAIGENLSGYLQATTRAEVGLGACPENLRPTNGREDLEKRTFTFTGVVGTVYEYRMNGGEWRDVDASPYPDFVIEVGDVTVLEGKLEVRAKATENYLASDPPLTNQQSFISTGELDITLEGDNYYGGILTASISSQALDSSLFSYQWSCDDGRTFDNAGNSYQVQKEDINKHIIVKVSLRGYEGADNTVTSKLIGKRPVTAAVNVTPRQYDGSTTAEAEVSLSGVINGDNVTASTRVEFENKNAGEDKGVRLINRQEGGSDIAYYDVRWPNSGDVKGTILPATLNLTMQASDKVYDGTTDAEVTFEAEPLPGDSVEATGTGQFVDKNVGTNKKVTPKDVEITGKDADNYTGAGSTASTTASITPRDIQIEGITVADKVYDGTTDAVITATFKGAMDDVSYTYTASFETPNVGKDKRVTATITLAGDSAKNYNLASGAATGTGNITRAPAPYDESDIPQGLTGIEGKKLSSVFIGKGFTWKDPSTVMKTVGRHSYPAIYNPDPSQYGDREMELEVLVQCAKHTWGDWTITEEPTKDEVGERQRICGVCGYIETEIIPRAPYIANEDEKVGWEDIIQAINNASSGTEIPVVMNGTETLPASVLDALQGREVSIVLQMENGITWTIRGEDITASTLKDINMAVTLYTDNIPSDVLDPYTQNKTAIQIHLAYSGEFGFVATLRVPFGNEFAGVNSTLYYYNPTRERLEQMDSNKITEDGIGRYDFTHASDYAVVIDKKTDVQGGDTPSGNNGNTNPTTSTTGGSTGRTVSGTSTGSAATTGAAGTTSSNVSMISSNGAKTEDDTPIMVYILLLLAGACGVGATVVYRQRRKTKE